MMNDPLLDLIDNPKPVAVDEVPGVYVRESSFADVMAYADRLQAAGDQREKYVEANVWLLIGSACDEHGKLRYTADDFEKLSKLPRKAMNAVMRAISQVNGMDSKTIEADSKN